MNFIDNTSLPNPNDAKDKIWASMAMVSPKIKLKSKFPQCILIGFLSSTWPATCKYIFEF